MFPKEWPSANRKWHNWLFTSCNPIFKFATTIHSIHSSLAFEAGRIMSAKRNWKWLIKWIWKHIHTYSTHIVRVVSTIFNQKKLFLNSFLIANIVPRLPHTAHHKTHIHTYALSLQYKWQPHQMSLNETETYGTHAHHRRQKPTQCPHIYIHSHDYNCTAHTALEWVRE